MSDEGREERVHTLIGRLESIKHSMFWLLKPAQASIWGSDQTPSQAVRAKAEGLRRIADDLDELADDIEVTT